GHEPGSPTPPRSRRRVAFAVAVAILVVLAVVLLVRWLAYNRTHASTDDATVDGDLYSVSPKIAGRVSQGLVVPNQFVHGGQLLVELAPSDLQAQLDQARATLAMERASARAAGTTVGITQKSTSSTTGQARATLDAARAQLEASREQVRAGA